jgi:hypothetical protein
MPLDPNIFLQGAQMRQQRENQVVGQLSNAIGAYSQGKKEKRLLDLQEQELGIKKAAAGLDLEKLSAGYLVKTNAGIEPTQEEKAGFQAFNQMRESEFTFDPTTGTRVKKYDPINVPEAPRTAFDAISSIPPSGAAYAPKYPTVQPQTMPQAMDSGNMGNVTIPPLPQASLSQPFERASGAKIPMPAGASPKTSQAVQEANIDIMRAGAVKKAENAAERESSVMNLDTVISAVDDLKPKITKAPGGTIESLAAWATNKAGYPSEKAIVQGEIDSTLPTILGNVKSVIRQKGEGTFTDKDQENLERMMPKDNDSNPVKMAKLIAVNNEMKRLRAVRTGSEFSPDQNMSSMPLVNSPSDPAFQSLPSGSKFRTPNGEVRTKK